MKIYIGTSGYYYNSWKKVFFPENTRDFLVYYAKFFNTVEINATFYRMFNQDFYRKLLDRVPEDFRIFIKVNQTITHLRVDNASTEMRNFRKSLSPLLKSSDHYGGILLQFPYSFKYSKENMKYLERAINFLPVRKAIEFRNHSWSLPFVTNYLTEKGVAQVNVDVPLLDELFPPLSKVTSKIGYFRMHGRSIDRWWNYKEPHERYDYMYSQEELKEISERINTAIDENPGMEEMYIYFNNHYNAKAVRNAIQMAGILGIEIKKPLWQDSLFSQG